MWTCYEAANNGDHLRGAKSSTRSARVLQASAAYQQASFRAAGSSVFVGWRIDHGYVRRKVH